MGKPGLLLALGGGGRNVLVPSKGELSCHLPWQCRTTGIMAEPFCTLKGLAFYVHCVKILRAFQEWAVLTNGRKIHVPPPHFTYQALLALLPGAVSAWSKPGTEKGSALTVLFSGSVWMGSQPGGWCALWSSIPDWWIDATFGLCLQTKLFLGSPAEEEEERWKLYWTWRSLWEPAGTIAEC